MRSGGTGPKCAIYLPKRIVTDVAALRQWLDERLGRTA
jgi:hypothetical protein